MEEQQPPDQTGSTGQYPGAVPQVSSPQPPLPASPPIQQPQAGPQSWDQIPVKDTSPKGSRKNQLLVVIAAAVVVIAALAFLIHEITRPKNLLPPPNNSSSLVKPAPRAALGVTPLGQSATGSSDTADLSIKVAKVMDSPQTTGDKPDPGTKYVEIDLSVANSGKGSQIVPGTFVYHAQDGKLLYTADSVGKGSGYANKKVQVTGKQPLDELSLGAGQTDSSHYLIYQIPANDKGGELIWYDGYYDTHSTELAVFALP